MWQQAARMEAAGAPAEQDDDGGGSSYCFVETQLLQDMAKRRTQELRRVIPSEVDKLRSLALPPYLLRGWNGVGGRLSLADFNPTQGHSIHAKGRRGGSQTAREARQRPSDASCSASGFLGRYASHAMKNASKLGHLPAARRKFRNNEALGWQGGEQERAERASAVTRWENDLHGGRRAATGRVGGEDNTPSLAAPAAPAAARGEGGGGEGGCGGGGGWDYGFGANVVEIDDADIKFPSQPLPSCNKRRGPCATYAANGTSHDDNVEGVSERGSGEEGMMQLGRRLRRASMVHGRANLKPTTLQCAL